MTTADMSITSFDLQTFENLSGIDFDGEDVTQVSTRHLYRHYYTIAVHKIITDIFIFIYRYFYQTNFLRK